MVHTGIRVHLGDLAQRLCVLVVRVPEANGGHHLAPHAGLLRHEHRRGHACCFPHGRADLVLGLQHIVDVVVVLLELVAGVVVALGARLEPLGVAAAKGPVLPRGRVPLCRSRVRCLVRLFYPREAFTVVRQGLRHARGGVHAPKLPVEGVLPGLARLAVLLVVGQRFRHPVRRFWHSARRLPRQPPRPLHFYPLHVRPPAPRRARWLPKHVRRVADVKLLLQRRSLVRVLRGETLRVLGVDVLQSGHSARVVDQGITRGVVALGALCAHVVREQRARARVHACREGHAESDRQTTGGGGRLGGAEHGAAAAAQGGVVVGLRTGRRPG